MSLEGGSESVYISSALATFARSYDIFFLVLFITIVLTVVSKYILSILSNTSITNKSTNKAISLSLAICTTDAQHIQGWDALKMHRDGLVFSSTEAIPSR